ncbi:hypothetical protein FDECE_16093 [Fusarium decemcellulare]|nr:hypothetical protein FDECE_16093 [Fusarium decemcellulare]
MYSYFNTTGNWTRPAVPRLPTATPTPIPIPAPEAHEPQTYSVVFPLIPVGAVVVVVLFMLAIMTVPWPRYAPDEEAALEEGRYERGMAVETVRVVRDGVEVYNRDHNPEERLYEDLVLSPTQSPHQDQVTMRGGSLRSSTRSLTPESEADCLQRWERKRAKEHEESMSRKSESVVSRTSFMDSTDMSEFDDVPLSPTKTEHTEESTESKKDESDKETDKESEQEPEQQGQRSVEDLRTELMHGLDQVRNMTEGK